MEAEDKIWLGVAEAYAKGAKCTRRKVGAILVRGNRFFSAGRNGTPAGEKNCTEGGCLRGEHYKRVPVKVDQQKDPLYWMCACGERYPCSKAATPNEGYDNSSCIHAELNSLLWASREQTEGATVYCTDEPCHDCFKHIRAAGVTRIVTPTFEWNK